MSTENTTATCRRCERPVADGALLNHLEET